ncbi:MAG TPA: spore germination protein GerW family protein [Candidatus Methanoperedens sp.]
MKVEDTLKIITEEIADMISTKTVIGEHLTIEGRTIIPVTKVSFGFGSGGGEGKSKSEDAGSGGGGGGGASIQPIGFLVVTPESVQLLTFKEKGAIEQIVGAIPEIMEKYRSTKGEPGKEGSSETENASGN